MILNVTNRKLNFETQPKDNIKTQTLNISADIKSNWYLQSKDHPGRASPNLQSCVMMETFSFTNFTLMDSLLTQNDKIRLASDNFLHFVYNIL